MIIISYNKQTWNEYDPNKTADENLANGGIINSDRLNHMEDGISNNDTEKVTDNKDGTEQLNGVQVQPFNKLSDTIGGRNLVSDSEQEFAGNAYGFHDYKLASLTELTPEKTYTVSFSAKVDDKAVNCNQYLFVEIWNSSWGFYHDINTPISTDYQRVTNTFTVPKGQTDVAGITVYMSHPVINGTTEESDVEGTGYIKELKLEQGSIATDWTPALEDATSTMASKTDLATAVSTKQDTIGYTPADDSKVAHLSGANNFDTVPTYGNNEIPLALNNSGSTANRPTGQSVGYQYFDTTLNKPIWYNGSSWVDSTGATV